MSAIKLVLPQDELDDIDRCRGDVPRERWIRELCKTAVTARDRFGEPCLLRVRGTPLDTDHEKLALGPFELDGTLPIQKDGIKRGPNAPEDGTFGGSAERLQTPAEAVMFFKRRIEEPKPEKPRDPLDAYIATLLLQAQRQQEEADAERNVILNEIDRRLREGEDMEPDIRQQLEDKLTIAKKYGWEPKKEFPPLNG